MTDQTSPRLVLSFGQKEILTDATTAYARATLENSFQHLLCPIPKHSTLWNRRESKREQA